MARQSLLRGDDPLILKVVLDEAALHRLGCERQVMRQQLQRMVEAAGMPNVSFQLLPFSAGPHSGIAGPFTILDFDDPADPGIVHLEHSTGDVYLDSADQVYQYSVKFERLQSVALAPEESSAFLVETVENL